MDFSRLKVTALDSSKNNKENIVIVFVGFKPTYFCCYRISSLSSLITLINKKNIKKYDMTFCRGSTKN